MGQPVVHFEIVGSDGAKLRSFYGDLFNWEINADNPWDYGIVSANGQGGIGGGIGASPNGARVTVYIAVPDPQAALERAEQLGGTVVMPVTEIPGAVTMALFADPEGNVVGVVKE